MDRRTYLRTSGSFIASGLLLGGCAVANEEHQTSATGKVIVSPNRVIGEMAGLRPYRKKGFRIEMETDGDKTIIHNYGHGGCGITLCWGSALKAVEFIKALNPTKQEIGVIGCGVIGLTTAREIQRLGFKVAIFADKLPPYTTSNLAGALWEPTTIGDPDIFDDAYPSRLAEVARMSYKRFTKMLGPKYGVRFIDRYRVGNTVDEFQRFKSRWEADLTPELYTGKEILNVENNPFKTNMGERQKAIHIDPDIFLDQLIRDFRIAGGNIYTHNFSSRSEIFEVGRNIMFNCAGMGAAKLFDDTSLVPVKGQLVSLLPQDNVDYILFGPGGYMMRRSNSIVLGGSHDEGIWNLSVDPQVSSRIMTQHKQFFDSY